MTEKEKVLWNIRAIAGAKKVSIEKLAEFPAVCPIIPEISNNVREYRKLVVSKEISVIYWLEDDYINVSFIWDTRRSLHHIYNIFKD